MTPADTSAFCRGDLILERIATVLQCATGVLIVPAALASQAHLPFMWWAITPLLVTMGLWFAVSLVIEAGQRFGLVGKKLSETPSSRSGDGETCGRRREAAPLVRKADDAVPSGCDPVTGCERVHVAQLPGRGVVRFRIGEFRVRDRSM